MNKNTAREGLPSVEFHNESDGFIPSHDAIARKAYFLSLNNSFSKEGVVKNWLIAEQQLIAEHSANRLQKRRN